MSNTVQLPVVGATFRPAEAKDLIRSMSVGDRVQLRADPGNEYDSTAVAVDKDGTHIGFLPAVHNKLVFAQLRDGAEIEAEIIAFENTLKPVIEFDLASQPFMPQPEEDMDRSWEDDEDESAGATALRYNTDMNNL